MKICIVASEQHHMTDIISILAKNIKLYRAKLDLTQEDLAKKAGVHRAHLANIERQALNPSLKTVERLAEALGMSASELLRPEDE
jgi:transcriptional regulator with XRE-family HTH domain